MQVIRQFALTLVLLTVLAASASGFNSCSDPIQLSCTSYYTGSNNTGNYNYSSYPFTQYPNGMTGPEAYHRLTIVYPALITITMSPQNQTQDLDLFLLSACNNTSGLAYSQNATGSEQISINLNPGTYYIIVDGWNGAVSNYTLNVNCTQNTACAAPVYTDLFSNDISCSSARINCSTSVGYTWAWAYRSLNSASWTTLPNTSTYYSVLSGLQASTTYEFKCAILCSNNTWSAWSPAQQFTTPSCGPTNNNCNNPITAICGNTYTGNNGTGSNNFNGYYINGTYNAETGPEMVYMINMPNGGALTLSLTGLSGDLDLFLLSSCSNNAVVKVSGNAGNNSESISVSNLPPGTYRIVIDGWNNTISNYALNVQCTGTGNGCAPTASQLFASNLLTGNSARLNTTYQGATSFDWRYRISGTGAWIDLNATNVNYADLLYTLMPYTDYEFQCAVYCNGSWSWSSSQFFNTSYSFNNEPCNAYELATGNGCYPVIGTNNAANTTWNPSPPGTCNNANMRDVWYKVQIPSSGKVKISSFPGTMNDAVVAYYSGSCNNLSFSNCHDAINGDEMPDFTIQGAPGSWWYIRVWGYGGSTGTFSICAQTLTNLMEDESRSTEDNTTIDKGNDAKMEAEMSSLRLYPVPAQEEINLTTTLATESNLTVRVVNMTGQIVQEETLLNAPAGELNTTIDISQLPSGTYLLRLRSDGKETTGKFVKM